MKMKRNVSEILGGKNLIIIIKIIKMIIMQSPII